LLLLVSTKVVDPILASQVSEALLIDFNSISGSRIVGDTLDCLLLVAVQVHLVFLSNGSPRFEGGDHRGSEGQNSFARSGSPGISQCFDNIVRFSFGDFCIVVAKSECILVEVF